MHVPHTDEFQTQARQLEHSGGRFRNGSIQGSKAMFEATLAEVITTLAMENRKFVQFLLKEKTLTRLSL